MVWLERDAARPYGNSRTGCRNEAKSHNGNGQVRGIAVLARKSSLLSKSAIHFIKSLELQLERELDRARAADLVQRIEASVRVACSEAVRQRLRRISKKRTTYRIVGRAEIRMVEEVKELAEKAEV